MKRLTDAWFEFNGVSSKNMGVKLLAMPKRPVPAEKGEILTIPGRDGFLWASERAARESITINVECVSSAKFDKNAVIKWLSGAGDLVFSDDKAKAYRARVIAEYATENQFLHFDAQRFTVPFDCQPYRYAYPAPSAVKMTSAGILVNPGTADSLPRIVISGKGDITVNINEHIIDVTGGSVIIDCESMDCLSTDGGELANNRVTMTDFPRLVPGDNAISWIGDVNYVSFRGRWRYL